MTGRSARPTDKTIADARLGIGACAFGWALNDLSLCVRPINKVLPEVAGGAVVFDDVLAALGGLAQPAPVGLTGALRDGHDQICALQQLAGHVLAGVVLLFQGVAPGREAVDPGDHSVLMAGQHLDGESGRPGVVRFLRQLQLAPLRLRIRSPARSGYCRTTSTATAT